MLDRSHSFSTKALLKVVVIGDPGVGKTSLMQQFVNKQFSYTYKSTIGADFLVKDMIVDEQMVTLQIWDTAGQERFFSLGAGFYRGVDGCALVYDVTNPNSFENLQNWRQELIHNVGGSQIDKPPPMVVIGNKIDLVEQRLVSELIATSWCMAQDKIMHFEVSAKDAINVEQAFKAVVKEAIANTDIEKKLIDNTINLSVQAPPDEGKKACSC